MNASELYPSPIPQEKPVSMSVVYGLVVGSVGCLLLAASSLTVAYNDFQRTVAGRYDARAAIEDINLESKVNQAEFERYAEMGDSMTLNGYNCNPEEKPLFDSLPWAKPDEVRAVFSADDYHVGNIEPDGTYNHFGYCSK